MQSSACTYLIRYSSLIAGYFNQSSTIRHSSSSSFLSVFKFQFQIIIMVYTKRGTDWYMFWSRPRHIACWWKIRGNVKHSFYCTFTLRFLFCSAEYRTFKVLRKEGENVWSRYYALGKIGEENKQIYWTSVKYNVSSRRTTLVTQSFLIVTFTI